MSHGLRWPSELDVLKTTARITPEHRECHKYHAFTNRACPATECEYPFCTKTGWVSIYDQRPSALADEAQRTIDASQRGGATIKSGAAHAGPSAIPSHPSTAGANPARSPNWTGCAIPQAAGQYPKVYPLVGMCRAAGLPEPIPELQWHPSRRYRADYGFPQLRVLVEIDGGLFKNGGHTRGAARLHDMAKDRAATLQGWKTLRYAPSEFDQILLDIRELAA